MLRLVVIVLKVSGVSFAKVRLSEGTTKLQLLRAFERSHLPLRAVLKVIDASKSMTWGKAMLLVDGGGENSNSAVDKVVESGLMKRVLAPTEITFSNSLIESWWRVLKHQ